MLAKEVMTRQVISVTPETGLRDAANTLLSNHVSAVPVIDAQGALVGIVSEGDLIHRSEIGTTPRHAWWQVFSLDPDEHAAEFLRVHGALVRHVMTRQVVTATEDTALAQIVDLFDRFHINRVPIVRDGRIVGIVSRSDLLRRLAHAQPASATGTRSDTAIAQDLDALLAEARWATVTSVSAAIEHEVNHGVIQLSGVVGSELEREALLVAARGIPGVKSVEDADLAVVPRDITAI
jgi:CBS domain-containing protein